MRLVGEPVLFLDFDGVLHPVGEPAFDEEFRLVENPRLFVWRPILEHMLEPYPNVRIIVSSDWRRLFDDATLVRVLGPLSTRFVGVVESYGPSRSDEVLAEVRRRSITQWLALDDHPSVVAASAGDGRFIACASATGVNSREVKANLNLMLAHMSANQG